MNREEARIYWIGRYEAARKWDDPHWEASERKEHRRYVDALNAAIKALSSAELPKGDYISREDAIDAICKVWCYTTYCMCPHADYGYCKGCEEIEAVDALPSAEAYFTDGNKIAEWIFNPTDAIDLMFAKPKCSRCGFESSDGGNYCSNCGARMKGGAE